MKREVSTLHRRMAGLSMWTTTLGMALVIASGAGCKALKKNNPDAISSAAGSQSGSQTVPEPPPPSAPRTVLTPSGPAPLSFSSVAKATDPAVVLITSNGRGARGQRARGTGSGFIIDKDGTILTNNHVVEGAETLTVTLADERVVPAETVARDARTDIAVIRVKAKSLATVPLGDSDKAEVGDWVVAIGNPFGLSHTVSAGIVSGKGRSRNDVPLDPSGYYDFIQTDASINPGNSGGPLINLQGEVVGINTAIRGGGAQGIGFAIPINMVKQLLPMMLRDGKVTRSALGIQIKDLKQVSDRERANLKITGDHGVLVEFVAAGSGAAKARIEPGDLILSFEGQPVDKATRLQWLASTAGVGKTVSLKVMHRGEEGERKVVLGELPEISRNEAPAGRPTAPEDDDD
jgi:serine protease Do